MNETTLELFRKLPENKQDELIAFLIRLQSYYSLILADMHPDESTNQ